MITLVSSARRHDLDGHEGKGQRGNPKSHMRPCRPMLMSEWTRGMAAVRAGYMQSCSHPRTGFWTARRSLERLCVGDSESNQASLYGGLVERWNNPTCKALRGCEQFGNRVAWSGAG